MEEGEEERGRLIVVVVLLSSCSSSLSSFSFLLVVSPRLRFRCFPCVTVSLEQDKDEEDDAAIPTP